MALPGHRPARPVQLYNWTSVHLYNLTMYMCTTAGTRWCEPSCSSNWPKASRTCTTVKLYICTSVHLYNCTTVALYNCSTAGIRLCGPKYGSTSGVLLYFRKIFGLTPLASLHRGTVFRDIVGRTQAIISSRGNTQLSGTWGFIPQLPLCRGRLWGRGHKGSSHHPPLRDRPGNEEGKILRSLLCYYG